MLFVAYCPDGSYQRDRGVGRTPNRDRLLAALPDLAAAGIRRVATISYPGVWRDAATAAAYFDPLNAAAKALGLRIIPGLWLHNIIEVLHGGDARGRHAQKPKALKTIAFREALLEVADVLMQATPGAGAVYIDGERVFWDTRGSAFWRDEINTFAVADLWSQLASWCARRQMQALLYHPDPAGVAAIRRIAAATLGGLGRRADVAAALRLLVPQPYFASASYALPTVATISQRIGECDIPHRMTRCGFISDHARGGFSPRMFRDYVALHRGHVSHAWYVTNHLKLADVARRFRDLVDAEGPLP